MSIKNIINSIFELNFYGNLLTFFKSCMSKINTVWLGLDNVYGNIFKP